MAPPDAVAAEIAAAAERQGITLGAEPADRLRRYLEVLLLWRGSTSLVSQRDPLEIVRKHVEDCFPLTSIVRPGWGVADLGTGAGLPGLILAVLCPASDFVLIESQSRKVSFLRATCREIGLRNVEIAGARCEALAKRPEYHGRFDCVVSRAVWSTAELLEHAAPFLRAGGIAMAMKGVNPELGEDEEVEGYSRVEVRRYELAAGERRCLIVAARRFT